MEILPIKILQQSRQVLTNGSDTVKLSATFFVRLNYDCCLCLKISLSRFTNSVFPLLDWLSVLVIAKVLVILHKIHVKKDPSNP